MQLVLVIQRVRDFFVARQRLIVSIGATVLLVAWLVSFFAGRDDRGRTARLTADAWYYHAYLPSLVLDQDLDFTNEYRVTHNWYRLGQTELDRPANVFGIGPAAFEAPLFVLGHVFARVSARNANGFSRIEVETTLLASLLFSFGALFFAYRLVRRRLGGRYLAAASAMLVACGGPLIYYAIRQPGYAHPFAAFWVAWLVDAWDATFDQGDQPRALPAWLLLGGLLGAASLARPQLALWSVILLSAVTDDVLRVARSTAGDRRRTIARLATTCVPRWAAGAALSLLVFSPQLLSWKAIYGHYVLVPQGPGFMRWDAPAWSEVLFSSRNGLFPWAPLYAAAALGWVRTARKAPRLTAALVLGFILQAVANGAAWDWWAGGSFGGRRFDACFVAFVVGLAGLLSWPVSSRRWLGRASRASVAGAALVCALLAMANVQLAHRYSAPSARIHGGVSARQVMTSALPWPFGNVAGWMSGVSNLPARVVFTLEYDRPLAAYDTIVGTHSLGELYPGLNSFTGRTNDHISLTPSDVRVAGTEETDKPLEVKVVAERVTALLGLNRRGPVTIGGMARHPEGGRFLLLVNGKTLAELDLSETFQHVSASLLKPARGTNEIEIVAPVGTHLTGWQVTALARAP